MKKFFLLLALVLMAGVVHAQNINFGNRANLTRAKRANANVSHESFSWGHSGENNDFSHMIFNDVQGYNINAGESMATKFDNFVIRVSGLEEGASYAVEFLDGTYGNGNVLATMKFWKDDVHIAPLPALLSNTNDINNIKSVRLKSNSARGMLILEEAYFISAYRGLVDKKNDVNGNSVYAGYLDLDDFDIGNAYIDPSYLIRSNRLWVEIDETDRSFTMKLDPELCSERTYFYYDKTNNGKTERVPVYDAVYNGNGNVVTIVYDSNTDKPKYSDNHKPLILDNGVETEYDEVNTPLHDSDNHVVYPKYDAGDGKFSDAPTLSFSLPYVSGIDMSEVTFTALDFDRSANVLTRCIYENKRVDLFHDPATNAYKAKARAQLVRDLYNSRYNGPFYDQTIPEGGTRGAYSIDLYANDCDRNPEEKDDNIFDYNFPLTRTNDQAITHVNSIYWQSFENRFLSSVDYQSATTISTKCQDISLTKNVIKARTTRTQLVKSMYNEPDACAMIYNTEQTGSAQIFGDWDSSNNGHYADLSSYKKMKISGTPNVSITVRYRTIDNGTGWNEIYAKTDNQGEVNIDLIDLCNKDANATGFYLNDIYFSYGQTGPYKVNNIELFDGIGKEVLLVDSELNSDVGNIYHLWNNDNEYWWQYGTIVRWEDNEFNIDFTADEGDLIYGHNDPYVAQFENQELWVSYAYADLTGYKALRIYDKGSGDGYYGLYFNLNTIPGTNYYDWGVAYTAIRTNPEKGYAEFDLSNYNFFHLNGIYGLTNDGVHKITLIENEEVDYVLYGNGSCYEQKKAKKDNSVIDAVNDKTAKVIDARPRCNNMEEPFEGKKFGWVQQTQLPYTANPNVLYVQRNNQFESRDINDDGKTYEKVNFITPSNVQSVNEFTSNNIKLTDGYSFYAPKKIKADLATYTREFKSIPAAKGAVNSIILPFAVNADDYNVESNNKNYGFYETFGVKQSKTSGANMAGILDEQNVNEGDWMLQFKQKTGNTVANTPYLYAVKESNTEVFTGVAPEGSKVIISETPGVETTAKKNMTNYDEGVTFYNGKESFYLRGMYEPTYMDHILFYAADGTLYRTPYMTVTPFRTIIKSPIDVTNGTWETDQNSYFGVAGNVKIVLAFSGDDESLDINSLVADGLFAEDEPIYNVAGQRVNTFGKGVYIVGGKKILVK